LSKQTKREKKKMEETATHVFPPRPVRERSKDIRGSRLQTFLVQYYPTPATQGKAMRKDILADALGINVKHLVLFETPATGIIGILTTRQRIRLQQMRAELTAASYNAADRSGLQIQGEDGLRIYVKSKREKDADTSPYHLYMDCVKKVCREKGLSLKKLLDGWKKPKPAAAAAAPDANDLLAMRQAAAELQAQPAAAAAAAPAPTVLVVGAVPPPRPPVNTPVNALHAVVSRLHARIMQLEAAQHAMARAQLQAPPAAAAAEAAAVDPVAEFMNMDSA
jgi:hypothetical protein